MNMSNLEPHHLAEFMYQLGIMTAAMIEMEGMKAENMQRSALGQSMAYRESDFQNILQNHGIDHNHLVEAMRRMQQ